MTDRLLDAEESADALATLWTQVRTQRLPQPVYPATGHGKTFFPGDDENNNVQAGAYARTLRKFTECEGNPTVLALCHPVKNAASGSLLPRGGSAFLNELDANTTLWSHSPGEVTELHWCGKIRCRSWISAAPNGDRLHRPGRPAGKDHSGRADER